MVTDILLNTNRFIAMHNFNLINLNNFSIFLKIELWGVDLRDSRLEIQFGGTKIH